MKPSTFAIAVADRAYPDFLVSAHAREPNVAHGDWLAKFVAQEVFEVSQGCEDAFDACQAAESAMRTAIRELEEVADALARYSDRHSADHLKIVGAS